MIAKLFNLKTNQRDQQLTIKSQIDSRIEQIESEIALTKHSIDTASVQKNGAISDFVILTMHKDTMRMYIQKLQNEKLTLNKDLEKIIERIVELQRESEQFKYILEEQKQEAKVAALKLEQDEIEEFIQSKYIRK